MWLLRDVASQGCGFGLSETALGRPGGERRPGTDRRLKKMSGTNRRLKKIRIDTP
jgi:hypothetical protein